jgi:hypothetical protein
MADETSSSNSEWRSTVDPPPTLLGVPEAVVHDGLREARSEELPHNRPFYGRGGARRPLCVDQLSDNRPAAKRSSMDARPELEGSAAPKCAERNPEHRGHSSRSGLRRPFTPASSSRLLTVTSL